MLTEVVKKGSGIPGAFFVGMPAPVVNHACLVFLLAIWPEMR